jgi:hypothetical protein
MSAAPDKARVLPSRRPSRFGAAVTRFDGSRIDTGYAGITTREKGGPAMISKRAMLVGAIGGMVAGMMMAAVEMIYGWASKSARSGSAGSHTWRLE